MMRGSWTRSYPGQPTMVSAARRWLAGILYGTPIVDDAVLLLSEIATNALRHTASGTHQGTFLVHVTTRQGWLRVEVTDLGALTPPIPASRDEAEEAGRGLVIVSSLASHWGMRGDGESRTVWFELAWEDGHPGSVK